MVAKNHGSMLSVVNVLLLASLLLFAPPRCHALLGDAASPSDADADTAAAEASERAAAAKAAGPGGWPKNTPTTVPTLPSRLDWDEMWVFTVAPDLAGPPTPPAAYRAARRPDLKFALPAGMLMAVRYGKRSPLGPYSEVFYIAGAYKAPCRAEPTLSGARIWVDDRGTQIAGRCIWGLTKELARFKWADGPGWRSLKMTLADGRTAFSANLTDLPEPVSAALQLTRPIFPTTYPAVQWPVDGVPGSPCAPDEPAYAATREALASTPVAPLLYDLKLEWETAYAVKAAGPVTMDSEAFTGRAGGKLFAAPLAVRLTNGAGILTAPRVLKC